MALAALASGLVFLAAGTAPGVDGAPSPAPPPGGEWFLVGGVHQPTVVQPLGAGRALLCTGTRCDVWDAATGTWTATAAVVLPINETSSVARRDGTVVVVDGARTVATAVWSAASGRWTAAAALPEQLTDLRLGALSDGRVLATGGSRLNRGPRAYLSTPQLDRWSVLADAPARSAALSIMSAGPRLVPTPSGVLMLDGPRAWRSSIGAPAWRPVSVPVPEPATGDVTSLQAWGDDILSLTPGGGRWRAALIGRDSAAERPVFGGEGAGTLSLHPIRTFDGVGAWWVETGGRHFWARHADESPVAVLPNRVDAGYVTLALDDGHLLALSVTGAVMQFALDGRPPPGAACGGLARYLAVLPPSGAGGQEAALVSTGCRAEAEGGHAPDLQRLVRGWARDEQRQGTGRALMCALHDPLATEWPRWFRDPNDPGRATCLAVAATWPAAQPAYAAAIAAGVYKREKAWWVDEALVASASTPALIERLTPMLPAAAAQRAYGFDNLHRRLCRDQTQASADRRHACAATASLKESAWRDEEHRAEEERRNRPRSRLPRALIATALYGGAIATAYATRDQDVARGIATGAGILGGATLGVTLAGLAALQGNWSAKEGEGAAMMIIGGALLGGTVGGWGFHAAARAPDHRAPLTAAGLFLPCLLAVVLPMD